MNIQEIKETLNNIITKNISLNLFFVLKDSDGNYIKRRVDLEQGDTTDTFIDLFRDYLDSYIIKNDDLSLCELSSFDERRNAIYSYDYNEYPKELGYIHNFNIEQEINQNIFSFSEEDLSSLCGYLIYLGSMNEGIVLYKKHYTVALIKRDSFLMYKKDRRFVKFDGNDMLRINGTAQLLKIDKELFVLDIKNFERNFGVENLVIKRAAETVEEIAQKGILEDIQVLKDSAEDITFARKLSKVREKSPVISLNISNDDIINFTKTNPWLKGQFKYSEDGKKIRLDTKASKNAFIKLLNDDFLRSELTKQNYNSVAKDRIIPK